MKSDSLRWYEKLPKPTVRITRAKIIQSSKLIYQTWQRYSFFISLILVCSSKKSDHYDQRYLRLKLAIIEDNIWLKFF